MKIINFVYDNALHRKATSLKSFRIIFFSDLHLGFGLKKRRLNKIVDELIGLGGDMYLFGGDLIGTRIERHYTPEEIEDIFNKFAGKTCFKIHGNHEFKRRKDLKQEDKDRYFQSLKHFTTLVNENRIVGAFNIIGLQECQYHHLVNDDRLYVDGKINILLQHQPDYFLDFKTDIMLAGHTHGGQIKLPLIPFMYRPKYGKKYLKGLYSNGQKYLVVSKGLGGHLGNIRFNASPDCLVIDFPNIK